MKATAGQNTVTGNLLKSPPKSPLKSGVGGDMGFGGVGRGKVGYVCVKVGWVLIT